MKKELGIIGLGKMGGNVARRLAQQGWKVIGYNRSAEDTKRLEEELQNFEGAYSIEELVEKLSKPRVILTILTSGVPTDEVIEKLTSVMEKEDIIIEAANSFYEDTKRRAENVGQNGIRFIDVGVSGGPEGALKGACLMVGGDTELFEYLKPLFEAMSKKDALAHFEGIGAGHFVKMVHNGMEYGMMQSIAEGFNLLKNGPYELDLVGVASIYNKGSVVESRLIGWLHDAYTKFGQDLEELSGSVGFTGEGENTVKTAEKLGLPIKAISDSLEFRKESQDRPSYIGRILTAIRNQFGGHSIERGKMT